MNDQRARIAFIVLLFGLWFPLSFSPTPTAAKGTKLDAPGKAPAWYTCATFERRISFRLGTYGSAVRGYLTPVCNQLFYVLRARAGQHMRVELASAGPGSGQVTFPGGGGAGGRIGTFGVIFDGTLPSSGDYRIRVSESIMAAPWSGYITLVVVIV
jgi:hypothetical protein